MRDNKPYNNYKSNRENGSRDHRRDYKENRRRYSAPSFPSPSLLQAYEDISEGAADRIIEMAENEQVFRHEWESFSVKAYIRSYRLGQICGLLIALGVLATSLIVVDSYDNPELAINIVIAGFSFLAINSIIAAKFHRFDRKPRRSSNYRQENEKSQESSDDKDK